MTSSSNFLNFPAELRLQVYSYLLPTVVKHGTKMETAPYSLRLTCRKVQNEIEYEMIKILDSDWEQFKTKQVHEMFHAKTPCLALLSRTTASPLARSLRINVPLSLLCQLDQNCNWPTIFSSTIRGFLGIILFRTNAHYSKIEFEIYRDEDAPDWLLTSECRLAFNDPTLNYIFTNRHGQRAVTTIWGPGRPLTEVKWDRLFL